MRNKIKITFLLSMFVVFLLKAQTIEKFSMDSGGASASAGSIEVLYTIGEVAVAERTSATLSISEGFINAQSRILMELLAFLQGPSLNPETAGLMNDNLRAGNYLPTTSPYADAATVDGSIFSTTGTQAIVDWVWVELRQATDNTKVVNGRSALLNRAGEIMDLDGNTILKMNASPTNYYVVVKHRNHLGAMSSYPIALSENEEIVDFIDGTFSTYGSNARVQLPSGNMALWAGDSNSSGQIKFIGSDNGADAIKDYVLADPSNILNFLTHVSTGYLDNDIDMNGNGKFIGANDDSSVIKDNVLFHPGNILNFITYTILETIPQEN